ncbi:hypothetical protein E2562_036631 [Oryza meyeriana var. granulata]|uniref:WW domain-containing protein n=1 Tax=Oryza meyeriana var. granulata TaxID=110450 RepID=A0A6G1FGG9_9ORYZ|nr:hypothetical protein E2562_036631 [Oryza meyeriana var. granulata]
MEAADAADNVLHGDLLECVLLRVPHDELTASPALVSWEWRRAARAAHRQHCRRQRHLPCLVAHVQGAVVGHSTHVYDPRSRAWASDGWRIVGALPVRRCACAGGDRVYALSLASMAVSEDALGAAWRELPPPRVWRVDPVVAAVGSRVVVLGGGCGAMAAAGVVEVLDEGAGWTTCAPMPAPLASRWVSAAASERRVYVVERRTGWASWFDPAERQWGPARRLQLPEGNNAAVESWAASGVKAGVGDANERLLVLAGGGGGIVSLWSVDGDTLLLDGEDNASMPLEMSEKLSLGATGGGVNIGVVAAGAASGYMYNASEPSKGAVRYELVAAGVGGGHDIDRSSKRGYYEKTRRSRTSRWEWEWLPCPSAAAAPMSSSSSAVVVFACSRSSTAPNK